MKTLNFSGHRPKALPWGKNEKCAAVSDFRDVLLACVERYINEGFTRFSCGMALGSDLFFAETVLALKTRYPHIILCAVLPCLNQDARWSEGEKMRYNALLSDADETVYIAAAYDPECMRDRNMRLAQTADRMLCVLRVPIGGTWQTYRMAKNLGKDCDVLTWRGGQIVFEENCDFKGSAVRE